ncbi:MAG: hypothetical protein EB084_20995, partial [Proteobacteria bacterium]|nr:hypothetical protein [Pseudomonadota bacterium]
GGGFAGAGSQGRGGAGAFGGPMGASKGAGQPRGAGELGARRNPLGHGASKTSAGLARLMSPGGEGGAGGGAGASGSGNQAAATQEGRKVHLKLNAL